MHIMISGSLCVNCSCPVLQTTVDSLLPLGHLPLAPAATAITWCHLGPCAAPGRACWEVWCVHNCLAQAPLCEGWSHRVQSAPKMMQKCQEHYRRMRRGDQLWRVLAKRGTSRNWRTEEGSQLAKCHEGTQIILQGGEEMH